jgi:hypothetical protein
MLHLENRPVSPAAAAFEEFLKKNSRPSGAPRR